MNFGHGLACAVMAFHINLESKQKKSFENFCNFLFTFASRCCILIMSRMDSKTTQRSKQDDEFKKERIKGNAFKG